ncbi:hypothetical protein [Curtobacterium sp. BRD11]|uniref:hypothetical protein n=1 Tax=Curtobacterium sp. BRD11 TaxID=2962581 RepID=UPI0028816DB5|nr:hypothetical protein [Curtobacterium sp. BRD11]MDT0212059.1 hypothetical protein [Curtobacterium sp. BRD11]
MSRAFVGGSWAYTVEEVFERYRPRFAHEPWFVDARETLVGFARRTNPTTPTAAYKTVLSSCKMGRFAHHHGIPLDPEMLFTPENVEWYVATELRNHGEHSRGTQRAALREIGRHVTRRAGWTSPDPRYQRASIAEPYSAAEQHALCSLAPKQRTERRRRALEGIVRLGLGAGLRGTEMEAVAAADFERRDRLLFVHVRGPRSRTIPIRRAHQVALLQLLNDYPSGPLLGPFTPDQRNPLSRIKSLLEIPAEWAPPLELRRLRATWMVEVLNADIQLSTFADAAGITDLRFAHLLPHLTPRKDPGLIAATLAGYDS